MKSMKIPEAVNHRRTDNTMVKRKRTKLQTWLTFHLITIEKQHCIGSTSTSVKYRPPSINEWEWGCGRVTVFNATFNNISAISWWSDLLVVKTRVHGENDWPAASLWQTLSYNAVSSTPRLSGIGTHNDNGDKCTGCIGS